MKDNSIRIEWNNLIYFYLYRSHQFAQCDTGLCVSALRFVIPKFQKELFTADNITGLYIKMYPWNDQTVLVSLLIGYSQHSFTQFSKCLSFFAEIQTVRIEAGSQKIEKKENKQYSIFSIRNRTRWFNK